jgi:hypothetical protein
LARKVADARYKLIIGSGNAVKAIDIVIEGQDCAAHRGSKWMEPCKDAYKDC